MSQQLSGLAGQVMEWGYVAQGRHGDPFNEIELDVVVSAPDGRTWRVPAWWAGGQEWRVRFAPPEAGTYRVTTVCTDAADGGLHGQAGVLEVDACGDGAGAATAGPALRVAKSGRTLESADGKPFFWLGDTWWMGLCKRWSWPEDFQLMTADRLAKGFTVIQIVAGPYPDMPGFDPRAANEAGFSWEADYARINPAWFDQADLRIQWLVRSGLVPCIVGCWGYYLPQMGLARMKRHWRYLVARWGAYGVLWCLAGEGAMPYYLTKDHAGDVAAQIAGWTEVGRYVRQIDPYHRPITIHPTQIGRDQVTGEGVLDFDMLQTGHGGYHSVSNTVATVAKEYARQPRMPVVVGEVSYEGIMHHTSAEVQRLTFWSAMLSGAGGFTYGANGIWQINTRQQPFGPSPHGGTWGNEPWEDVHRLPGSTQIGLGKRLLERYEWWNFQPHPEWTDPAGSPASVDAAFAAGIAGKVRVIYFFNPPMPWTAGKMRVTAIEPDVRYRGYFWDPRTAQEHPIGPVEPSADGAWIVPMAPTMQDWVLVLERH